MTTKNSRATQDPIARRDVLLAQYERVQERADAVSLAHREAELGVMAADEQLAARRVEEMLGDADQAAIETAREEVRRQEVNLAEAAAENLAAGEAFRLVRTAIEKLHEDERAAFIAHAEESTAAAHDALDALREPYERAVAAWHEARAVWGTFVRDLDDLGHPPLPPLLAVEEVFGVAQCRPAQLATETPVAEVLADLLHEWGADDGATMTTEPGDGFDRELAQNPSWRLIAKRPRD